MAEVQGDVTPGNTAVVADKTTNPDDSTAKNLSAQRKYYEALLKEERIARAEAEKNYLSKLTETEEKLKSKDEEYTNKNSEYEKEKSELLSYKVKYESLDKIFDEDAIKELEDLKSSLGEEKFSEFSKVVTLDGLSGYEKIQKIKASKGLFGAPKPPVNPPVPGGVGSSDANKRYLELARKQKLDPSEAKEFKMLGKELGKL